jgi:hypothetical protein
MTVKCPIQGKEVEVIIETISNIPVLGTNGKQKTNIICNYRDENKDKCVSCWQNCPAYGSD